MQTIAEIRLKEYGLESIEVIDNGVGIDSVDFVHLAQKYHTSKIRNFDDLSFIQSFGFRGILDRFGSYTELQEKP